MYDHAPFLVAQYKMPQEYWTWIAKWPQTHRSLHERDQFLLQLKIVKTRDISFAIHLTSLTLRDFSNVENGFSIPISNISFQTRDKAFVLLFIRTHQRYLINQIVTLIKNISIFQLNWIVYPYTNACAWSLRLLLRRFHLGFQHSCHFSCASTPLAWIDVDATQRKASVVDHYRQFKFWKE